MTLLRTLAVVTAILVHVLFSQTSASSLSTYCWDPSPEATGYRVYWSLAPDWWPSKNLTEVSDTCLTDPSPTPIPGEVIFYVVTAFNAEGESATEHGPVV
jgi:hypothetical protein